MVTTRARIKGIKGVKVHTFRTFAEAEEYKRFIGREGKVEIIGRKRKKKKAVNPFDNPYFMGGFR